MEPINTASSPDDDDSGHYTLRLFVTGASAHSVRAITNIKKVCEEHLAGRYTLEIVDVHQQKEVADQEQLVALPLLIKYTPRPQRRLIGDMSDTKQVLRGLGLS